MRRTESLSLIWRSQIEVTEEARRANRNLREKKKNRLTMARDPTRAASTRPARASREWTPSRSGARPSSSTWSRKRESESCGEQRDRREKKRDRRSQYFSGGAGGGGRRGREERYLSLSLSLSSSRCLFDFFFFFSVLRERGLFLLFRSFLYVRVTSSSRVCRKKEAKRSFLGFIGEVESWESFFIVSRRQTLLCCPHRSPSLSSLGTSLACFLCPEHS